MSEALLAGVGALGVGGAVFFATSGAAALLGARRTHTELRLGVIAGGLEVTAAGAPGARRAGLLDRRMARVPVAGTLQRELRRAGLAWRVSDYVAVMAIAASLGVLVTWAASGNSALAALAGAVTGMLPVLLVRRSAGTRARRLNAQVSDLLDLLASSMRAGFGFAQSLELAAREQPQPLAGEVRHTLREIDLGVSTDEALERLVARTGDGDLELVITAVLIQRRVGGNLAAVLENISHMIRDRARVRGEIRTLTAQARASAKVVGFLPVVLAGALALMQPGYMTPLFEEPTGRLLLVAAVLLETVGFVLVNRIGNIDY